MKVTFASNQSHSLNTEALDQFRQGPHPEPTLIKKKELAARLSVSPRTIDNWVAKRIIPYVQVNPRFYLYEFDAVLAAVRKHYQIDPVQR